MKVYEKRRVFIVIACYGISTIVFARGFGVLFGGWRYRGRGVMKGGI